MSVSLTFQYVSFIDMSLAYSLPCCQNAAQGLAGVRKGHRCYGNE